MILFTDLSKVFTGVTVPPVLDMLDLESCSVRLGAEVTQRVCGETGRGVERRGRGDEVQDVGVTPLSLVSMGGLVLPGPPGVILPTLLKTLTPSFQSLMVSRL